MAIQATRVRIETFATANHQSSEAPVMRIILTPPDQVSWEEFFLRFGGKRCALHRVPLLACYYAESERSQAKTSCKAD